MIQSVHEFQLRLSREQADEVLTVAIETFPGRSPLCTPARTPFDLQKMRRECVEPLLNHIERTISPLQLQQIGEQLASVLLPPTIYASLFGALTRGWTRNSRTMRLRLVIDDPALASVPWEFAYLPISPPISDRESFVALLPHVQIIRQTDTVGELSPLKLDRLKILIAWVDRAGAGYGRLAYARHEAKTLIGALTQAPALRRLEVRELENVTPQQLESCLNEFQPNALHFIGHGSDHEREPAILLPGPQSFTRMSAHHLARLLAYKEFRLLTLSACQTAGLAHRLVQMGVPAVVAMQLPWTDAVATSFTQTLYAALAMSTPLDEAVALARQNVRFAGPDWGNPVLHLSGTNLELMEMKAARPPDNLPFPRNPYFVGRDVDLCAIGETLAAQPAMPVAIPAMGGMGKTQLALEYAHRKLFDYPGGVFWIRADDLQHIRAGYESLGPLFSVPEGIPDKADLVLQRIKESPGRLLIVFDNLDTADAVRWLPSGELIHVLITTRDADLVRGFCRHISLTDLDESDCIKLMAGKRSNLSEMDLAAARLIIAKSGSLPLALALISYYADRLQLGLTECAAMLNEAPLKTLTSARRRFSSYTGHDGSLFDTVGFSYSQLNQAARKVLNTACCFASKRIDASLLMIACGMSNRDVFREAISDIERFCLAQRDPDARYNLHDLVGEYVRLRLSARQRASRLRAVSEALSEKLHTANSKMDWHPVRADIHHCIKAAQLCEREELQEPLYYLAYETGTYLTEHYELEAAAAAYQKAVMAAERAFGDHSTQVARCGMSLATTTAQLGDHHNALDMAANALDLAIRTLPTRSAMLADLYNDKGYIVKKGGDPKEALKLYTAALTHCADNTSATYSSILNNLGAAYEVLGRCSDALESFRDAMRVDVVLFGSDHPRVAIRLNSIGRILALTQNWSESLAAHEQAYEIYRETYGAFHPDLAASLYYRAMNEQAMGHLASAELHYVESLEIYERFFGFMDYRTNRVNRCLEELTRGKTGSTFQI